MIREAPVDPEVGLPSRTHPRGDGSLETLFDDAARRLPAARGGLGDQLARRYDGDLSIPLRADRPTIVANFVETLDGVAALDAAGRTGGGAVSGFNPADRFVMGLLRALADVVLVGAGTVRASRGGPWTANRVHPAEGEAYARLRADLGLDPQPVTLIVTKRGNLDPGHPGLIDPRVPVVIAGPKPAVERLRGLGLPDHVRVELLPDGQPLGRPLSALAGRLGAGLVVSEAGPHLTGELIAEGAVDELFLTISPQLAGRAPGFERLSLIEGRGLWPHDPRWLRLRSVRRGNDHLFLRYRFEEADHAS